MLISALVSTERFAWSVRTPSSWTWRRVRSRTTAAWTNRVWSRLWSCCPVRRCQLPPRCGCWSSRPPTWRNSQGSWRTRCRGVASFCNPRPDTSHLDVAVCFFGAALGVCQVFGALRGAVCRAVSAHMLPRSRAPPPQTIDVFGSIRVHAATHRASDLLTQRGLHVRSLSLNAQRGKCTWEWARSGWNQ
jgi:hypothetical protein